MNRKQRRVAASKRGQKKMGVSVKKMDEVVPETRKEPEARLKEVTKEDPAEQAERIQKLITGRISPPSDFVDYLVSQIRRVMQEVDQVNKQLQTHQEAVRQAENRARELRGMRQKYVEDIQTWDKKAREAEKRAGNKEAAA